MQTWIDHSQTKQNAASVIAFTAVRSTLHTDMDRKKILVVDDSPIILKTISMKLKSHGYDVLTAADGATAVSTARRERPDLILLDISFPPDVAHGGGVAWDGFLIMGWLRRMDEAKDIPIIIITGDQQLKDKSLASGAVGFFHKPIDNDELISMIRNTIGEGGPMPAPQPPAGPPPVPRTPPV